MKKKLGSKKGLVVFLIALVVLSFVGLNYARQQKEQTPVLSGFNDIGELQDFAVPSEVNVGAVVEIDDVTASYEVRVRLEDLGLRSEFPSFVNDLFTKEGEGTLNVKNHIFSGWNGALRGVLVSIEPKLSFFTVGDVLVIETTDRNLAMTVPGDVITFHCEVEIPGYMYLGIENPNPLQLELLELESCVLARINH